MPQLEAPRLRNAVRLFLLLSRQPKPTRDAGSAAGIPNPIKTMSDTIDIKGISKAAVLAALYNASKPLGMGMFNYRREDMSEAVAQRLIDESGERPYFDYLCGRVMKIGFKGDDLDVSMYDRDNGKGAAARALAPILAARETSVPS